MSKIGVQRALTAANEKIEQITESAANFEMAWHSEKKRADALAESNLVRSFPEPLRNAIEYFMEKEKEMENIFWFVARLDGNCMTKKRHKTYVEACEEAQRLARLIPGVEFFVAEAEVSYKLPEPTELTVTHYE